MKILPTLSENRVTIDYDEKRQHPDFDDIARMPPGVGIFDEPTRCYPINQEWAKIVMGWVGWLATTSAWPDAQDELYTGITEILRFTIGEDCVTFQLRQNPTNSCVLEQSLDGGQTWVTAFDFSLCLAIVDGASQTSIDILSNLEVSNFDNTVNNFIDNVYNDYVTNYVNSITNLVPELGYGDTDDEFRDDALCYALGVFVDLVCQSRIDYYQSQSGTASDLLAALAFASALTVIVGLSASGVGLPAAAAIASITPTLAAGLGLGGAFYNVWYVHALATTQAQYEDMQAREDVVCCLLANLAGANVDQDDFIGAFTTGCVGLTANATAIFDACEILAGEDATYAAFVENMRIGFQSAKLGLLPACPCGATVCAFLDFSVSDYGFINIDASGAAGFQSIGEYTDTWRDSLATNASPGFRGIYIGKTFDVATIFNVTLNRSYLSGQQIAPYDRYNARVILLNNGNPVYDSYPANSDDSTVVDADFTVFQGVVADEIRIAVAVSGFGGALDGSAAFNSLTINSDVPIGIGVVC